MLKFSVLTLTYRSTEFIQGRAEDLKRQTLPPGEFEWVVVDDLYEARREEIASWKLPFAVQHVPPRRVSQYAAACAAVNSGLVYCKGTLVHAMADYVQPTSGLLARHWGLYEQYGPKCFISGMLVPWECPECATRADRPWSMPDEAWVYPCHTCDTRMVIVRGRNMENRFPSGEGEVRTRGLARQTFFFGRNDTVPLEGLLKVNGMDERQDGALGGMDSDLAMRLMNAGYQYIVDGIVPAFLHPHVREKMDDARVVEERTRRHLEWAMEVEAGRTWAPHGWSILEERKRLSG